MKGASMAALTLAVLWAAGCVPGKKAPETEPVFTYADWGAFNTVLKSGNVLFGAGTDTTPESKGVYSLIAVMFADSCAPSLLSVTYDLPAPAAKTVKSQPAMGEIRVDDLAPIQASYTYEMTQGKPKVFIDFNEAFKDKTLSDQFSKGQMIRAKAVVEGKELAFRFTLKNAVNAVRRAVAQCKEEAAFKGTGGGARPAQPAPGSAAGPSTPPMGGSGRPGADDSKFFK